MSKGFRWPLEVGRAVAQDAVSWIADATPRSEIAGSIRRGRPTVGDIDLVVILDDSPWAPRALHAAFGQRGYIATKDGAKIMAFVDTLADRPPIDVYVATAETWGITLLVRTGSAGHNIFLADHGRKQLPTRRLSVARGILDTAGVVVASRTEEDCFAALGVAFVPPEEREAPEFDAMVRAEEVRGDPDR